MSFKDFIQQLVGTDRFVLKDARKVRDHLTCTEYMRIIAHPHVREQHRCPICGRKSPYYDRGRGVRRWRCLDLGGLMSFIEAPAPRVRCPEHGVLVAAVPWARHGSNFCRAFEEQAAWLARFLPKSALAEFLRIDWHTVGAICGRVWRDHEAANKSRFDGLVRIGIDETSYKKGHKYMTVVIDHDTSAVVWCGIGHGKEVLSKFFRMLTPEQRASIRLVSADGARWIASCVEEFCPNAERCIDPFHVAMWGSDALDEVRRAARAEARKSLSDRAKTEQLKGAKYVLLKRPESLSDAQSSQLKLIAESEPKLYRAYLLKEALRLALKAAPDEVEEALVRWMSWAQRCRIPRFRELREKIKRNLAGIAASVKHSLSNARMEAINNKIKLQIRRAFGFRNFDNMISMIMLTCSGITMSLPGR